MKKQWGWFINTNNKVEFFTRAIDVARVSDLIKKDPRNDQECRQNDYYNIAETTWLNMQNEISEWITQFGGQSTIIPSTAIRIDKNLIQELLNSNDTISQINCD